MVEELKGICEQVHRHAGRKAQNLTSSINVEVLLAIHKEMDGTKVPGIDDVTKADYTEEIMPKLETLVTRMRHEAYKPQAFRRTYIDKPGSSKKRPLGISCYEDKLVERTVAQLLETVYEPIFMDFLYGFRPGRNCHQAIKKILNEVQNHKVNYVVEADIRSFFDTLDHEWLVKFLEHDIADSKLIGIIQRQLKAGIMEDGKYLDSEAGKPQGGVSAILANLYLHYVLDLWFDVAVRRERYRGEAYLTSHNTPTILRRAFNTRMTLKSSTTHWVTGWRSLDWCLCRTKRVYWSLGGSRSRNEVAEDRESRRHSIFWVSLSIAVKIANKAAFE